MGSNVKKNYVYEISVRNTNKEAVTVVIYDRVPVSKRKEIMVSVGEIAGADYDVETGILKWTKTLEAGKSEAQRKALANSFCHGFIPYKGKPLP